MHIIYTAVYIIVYMYNVMYVCVHIERNWERDGVRRREGMRERYTLSFEMILHTGERKRENERKIYSLFWNDFTYIIKDSNILIIIFEFYCILIQPLVTHWNVWSRYKNKNILLIKSPISPSFALLRNYLGKAIFPEHKGKLHRERLIAPHSFFLLPGMKMQEDIKHQDKSPIVRVDMQEKDRDINIISKSYASPDACLQTYYVRGENEQ